MLAGTSDSASSNDTLVTALKSQLGSKALFNPKGSHVKCIAHKLGLIANKGFAALKVSTTPSRRIVTPSGPSLTVTDNSGFTVNILDEAAFQDPDDAGAQFEDLEFCRGRLGEIIDSVCPPPNHPLRAINRA